MFSLNRAQLVGNVTRDPEMRYTPNGQAVCSFSVATNRRWKGADGATQEQTEFHNIVAWRKLAEIVSQYLKKGNKVYVEGRLQTRSWEGQDGGKRNRTEIVAENLIFLTPKGSSDSVPSAAPEINTDEIEEFKIDKTEEKSEKTVKKTVEKPTKKEEPEATNEDDINLDEIPF